MYCNPAKLKAVSGRIVLKEAPLPENIVGLGAEVGDIERFDNSK